MQHPAIGHDDAKTAVTFREIRNLEGNGIPLAWQAANKCVSGVVQKPQNPRVGGQKRER
jgi:hypothetical protein